MLKPATAAAQYIYTDWFPTNDDNAWLGLEWWFDNFGGAWYGYTITWDPRFLTQYGDQYLYYASGFYYGYYYWR